MNHIVVLIVSYLCFFCCHSSFSDDKSFKYSIWEIAKTEFIDIKHSSVVEPTLESKEIEGELIVFFKGKKVAELKSPYSLSDLFELQKKDETDGDGPFIGKGRNYIVIDEINKKAFNCYIETDPMIFSQLGVHRLRTAPLAYIDGKAYILTDLRHTISHLKFCEDIYKSIEKIR